MRRYVENIARFYGRPIWLRAATAVLAVVLLSGCGDTARKMLGFDKTSPDEFKIISRAPLSLPPDYGLRPPQPGAVRPQERTIPERALAAVTGTSATALPPASTSNASSGELALLAHA